MQRKRDSVAVVAEGPVGRVGNLAELSRLSTGQKRGRRDCFETGGSKPTVEGREREGE